MYDDSVEGKFYHIINKDVSFHSQVRNVIG